MRRHAGPREGAIRIRRIRRRTVARHGAGDEADFRRAPRPSRRHPGGLLAAEPDGRREPVVVPARVMQRLAGMQHRRCEPERPRIGVIGAAEQVGPSRLEPVRKATRRVVHLPVGAEQVDAEKAPALVHVAGQHEHAGVSARVRARAPRVAERRIARMGCIVRCGRRLGRTHVVEIRRYVERGLGAALENLARDTADAVRRSAVKHHPGGCQARA